MCTLHVNLSDEQINFINEQVIKRDFKNFDEYLAEQRRQAEDELERLIQESIDSGEPEEITEQWLNELEVDLKELHKKNSQ